MGYVGLPTALSLADGGAQIIGCDISETRIAEIKSGRVDLLDRDHARLARHLEADRIELTSETSATTDAEIVVICVPTPIDAHQTPDLTALRSACESTVANAMMGQSVVLTSTTYVGCTRDLLIRPLETLGFRAGRDVFVAFSPERIDPGVEAHVPTLTPRVVGGATVACGERAAEVMRHTAQQTHIVSSPEAAEMTKLLENTFRAVNIALANELSDAARELKVDILEVIGAATTKPFGFMPFYPGAGVGGHCIPCDPHYLLWQLRARRLDSPVVNTAMAAIVARPREIARRAREVLGETGRQILGAKVLVLGVTYKPGVADLRESPALSILDELASAGALVSFADPLVESLHTPNSRYLECEKNPQSAAWDLVVVHTVHPAEDYTWLARQPAVLDPSGRIRDMTRPYLPSARCKCEEAITPNETTLG
ncbi:UDP-glucose 6-dehydrogenase [Mycobacterium sp. CBMA 234]|nr:UDP-glucose 6-dehydrogenase [Mycolicibacterium sp. CBMA 234]